MRAASAMPYSKPTSSASASACVGPERVERPRQQPAEQVVVLEGEREGGVERTGEVALRRTAGGARRAVVGRRPTSTTR